MATLNARIPDDIKKMLEELARNERRSITQEIIKLIEEKYNEKTLR